MLIIAWRSSSETLSMVLASNIVEEATDDYKLSENHVPCSDAVKKIKKNLIKN